MRQTPSTPQPTRIHLSQNRTPLSHHSTPAITSHTLVPSLLSTPSSPLQPVSSTASSFNLLPPPFSIEGTSLLEEHRPLPNTPNTQSILFPLIAYQAIKADRVRVERDNGNVYSISWEWYIKELTRRKFEYRQIAELITALCSLLELTTDAGVFFYCSRPERSPSNRALGRGEVIYSNAHCRTSQAGRLLHSEVLNAAHRFGDHLSLDWTTRQNTYDATAVHRTIQYTQENRPLHRLGDFPRVVRFNSSLAGELVDAIWDFDWTSFGLPAPFIATSASGLRISSPSQDHGQVSLSPAPSGITASLESDESHDEDSDHDDESFPAPRSSGSSFVGRRATTSELHYMGRLGLEELQKAKIRLALWEEHPNEWYRVFRSIVGSNLPALYGLLGAFSATLD